jgi:hypothetical protein
MTSNQNKTVSKQENNYNATIINVKYARTQGASKTYFCLFFFLIGNNALRFAQKKTTKRLSQSKFCQTPQKKFHLLNKIKHPNF